MNNEVTPPEGDDRNSRLDLLLQKLSEVETLLRAIQKEVRATCALPKRKKLPEEKGSRKAKRKIPPFATPDGLKQIREHLGLTQTQAAEKVGVALSVWQNWEYAIRLPNSGSMNYLALWSARYRRS